MTSNPLDLDGLQARLRSEIQSDFFQSEANFKPLMHVVDVLLEDVTAAGDGDEGQGDGTDGRPRGQTSVPEEGLAAAARRRGSTTTTTTWLSVRTQTGKVWSTSFRYPSL